MTVAFLLTSLKDYHTKHPLEGEAIEQTLSWIERYGESAFLRENLHGHITGSMFVVNKEHTKVLLMFHHKLQMWVQFGGHADGETDIRSVALREFHEESGIVEEPLIIDDIFDIDVHTIPARPTEPEHIHFDILYLSEISESVAMKKEEEKVEDLRWVDIDSIKNYSNERRMQRLIDKIHNLP